MLNPEEKAELIRLQRQALRNVETDNWREYEEISERLQELTDRWCEDQHPLHGTVGKKGEAKMKDDLFKRGNRARQERLNTTAQRQAQEVQRKEVGQGTGIIGRGNKKREKAGMGRHIYGS